MANRGSLSEKSEYIPLLLLYGYGALLIFMNNVQPLHILILALIGVLYYTFAGGRRFVVGLLPLFIYVILYDSLRYAANHTFQVPHIQDLYEYEKALFGIKTSTGIITPNEWFYCTNELRCENEINRLTPLLNFLGGISYGLWFPVPVFITVFFFFKAKELMARFAWCFLIANIIGIIIYYIYPAAPPWYVHEVGFEFNANQGGFEAGLRFFDQMVGAPLFKGLYGQGPNAFAAMPSMHSAFPVMVLYYGLRYFKWGNILLAIHMVSIWFFAVYLQHHYLLDVIPGILVSLTAIGIVETLTARGAIKEKFEQMIAFIEGKPTD